MIRCELAVVTLSVGLFFASVLPAQTGTLDGRIVTPEGEGLGGIEVSIDGEVVALSDSEGRFAVAVAPGTRQVVLTAGDDSDTSEVEIPVLERLQWERALDWELSRTQRTVVESVSGTPVALLLAPVAVTVLSSSQLESESAHGQLPKLVEFAAGVDLAQSGLYDFNLATRGRNDSQSRQIAVRIDGRDPSQLFFGGQEWASLALPLADLARAEMARGPMSAIYGGNASGGALSLVTRSPRDHRGGSVNLAGGDQSSLLADLLWSQRLSDQWYLKLQGSYRENENASVSRNASVEYAEPCSVAGQSNCLPLEAVGLRADDTDEIAGGAVRVDYYPGLGGQLTVEGGASAVAGPVVMTDLGRIQIVDSGWQWGRFDYALGLRWNLFGSYKNREADQQTVLATGQNVELTEESWRFGVRTSWDLSDRVSLAAGANHVDEEVDTSQLPDFDRANPRARLSPFNRQGSLLFQQILADADAAHATLDWRPSDTLSVAVGVRYDDSTLHDPQWSPRGSLVFSPNPSHSLRLSYGEGFQVPTYGELEMQFDSEPAFNLATIEPMCALYGVSCGFDLDATLSAEDAPLDVTPDTRVLTLGNQNLVPEETRTIEIGYRGNPSRKLYLALDYYLSEIDNLISGPLPQLGTSLGRTNPSFGAYSVPSQIPGAARDEILAELQRLLGDRFADLSVNRDGTPLIASLSYANIGTVDSQGVDLELDWSFTRAFTFELAYSWLDYEVDRGAPDLAKYMLANAPENRASTGFRYAGARFDGALYYRWQDEFQWLSGPFSGLVDSYSTVDLVANFKINSHVSLGINVANALDEDQWQAYGGNLQERRGLATLRLGW